MRLLLSMGQASVCADLQADEGSIHVLQLLLLLLLLLLQRSQDACLLALCLLPASNLVGCRVQLQ